MSQEAPPTLKYDNSLQRLNTTDIYCNDAKANPVRGSTRVTRTTTPVFETKYESCIKLVEVIYF